MNSLTRAVFAIGGFACVILAYAGGLERRLLSVSKYQVILSQLPPGWDGLHIVQLSDLHLGSLGAPLPMLRRAISVASSLKPDLIVLTGDYVNDGRARPLDMLAPLAQTAPTIAILGNHDYFKGFAGADTVVSSLEAQGITVLRNTAFPFRHNGCERNIVGFDSVMGRKDEDHVNLLNRLPALQPLLTLIHEPDVIRQFPPCSAPLTLAGHTHGAQIRLSPIRTVDWISFRSEGHRSYYPRGWFTVNGNRLYVSRGLGVAWLPLRFAARPELTSFTLMCQERSLPSSDDRHQQAVLLSS